MPVGTGRKLSTELPKYRRHIVVDNKRKVISIEVMANPITKNINYNEYFDITNGAWYKHVPKDYVPVLRESIASGYVIEPVYCMGVENEDFRIIQIVDLVEQKDRIKIS